MPIFLIFLLVVIIHPPPVSSLSKACRHGRTKYQNMVGSKFDCSCRDTLAHEIITCKEKCMTCHREAELCSSTTHTFKQYTDAFFGQGSYLVDLDTDVTVTSYDGLKSSTVKSRVDISGVDCDVWVHGSQKCTSCSVKSNPRKTLRLNLDCSNVAGQGHYDCRSGSVQPGSYDVVGSVLVGIPLNCVEVDDERATVCPGQVNPFEKKPTKAPTKKPPPTHQPTTLPELSVDCSEELEELNECKWDGCWIPTAPTDCDSLRKIQCHLDYADQVSFLPGKPYDVCPEYRDECQSQFTAAKSCMDESVGTSSALCPYPTSEECVQIFSCSQELKEMQSCLSSHQECSDCLLPEFMSNCTTVESVLCAVEEGMHQCCPLDDVCEVQEANLRDCAMSAFPLLIGSLELYLICPEVLDERNC